MRIRKATFSDLAALQPLYAAARRFMRENGNPGQWGSARPSTMQLFRDIAEGRGHVLLENGRIEAAFSFTCAPDPDYAEIDGAWLNDAPYGVVHRLASSGRVRVCRAVRQHPDLRGVYISVNGQLGACDALRELGLRGRVHLICHDLFQQNVDNVRAGLIDFLIDQDAETQGSRPIELLFDRLLVGAEPPGDKLLTRIDIRNRYNL